MTQTHTPGEGRRPHHRLRLLVTATALASLAPVGPTTPAGAWGGPVNAGCGATGASGRSFGAWRGFTSGSNCQGNNWVQFRSWGFTGDWLLDTVADPSNPTIWGGANHKGCFSCTPVGT